MPEAITSVHNPRIKNLVRLREGSHRRRQHAFLIEGVRELDRAAACQWPLHTVYFCEELFPSETPWPLLQSLEKAGVELVRLGRDAFLKSAYRQHPDGILAVAEQVTHPLDSLRLSPVPLIVVLEQVEKPGNIGAAIRTANAAGADALILSEPKTDIFNPNVIRASQGAFFSTPFATTDNVTLVDYLERRSIQPLPLTPEGRKNLWEAPLTHPTALILGSEEAGLSRDWREGFTGYHLPMSGVSDSLNVSATVAVALFEAVRQRTQDPA